MTAAASRSSTSVPKDKRPIPAPSAAKRKRARWVVALISAAIVGAMALVLWLAPSSRQILVYIAHLLRGLGDWGPAAFGVIYAVCCVTLVPAAPLSVIAGILYGWKAVPLVMAAAMTASIVAFAASRYLLRDWVLRHFGDNATLKVIDKAVAHDGWKIVTLFRMSPLIPFNLQNYLLGATRIRFKTYVASTFVGMIPGTAVFVYLGAAFGKAAFSTDKAGPLQWTLVLVGFLATIIVTWIITKRARERLARVGLRRG